MTSVEQRCLDYLQQRLVPAVFADEVIRDDNEQEPEEKEPPLEPIPITRFTDLVDVFAESLYWTQSMSDTLAVGLAGNVGVRLGGELLWCYIRGPASSGKSTICDAISAAKDYSKAVSRFTGMHSGFKLGKSKKDHSTLRLVNKKMMVIKDWTTVLSMPEGQLTNIYGELRDIYDGATSVHYRNDIKREFKDIRFSMLAGVTDEVLRHNHSHLGERFYAVDISDPTHGSFKHVKTGLRHIYAGIQASYPKGQSETIRPDKLHKIKRATLGFLNHLHQQIEQCEPVHIPDTMLDRFTQSARLIARIRGRVVREGSARDVAYRPRPEVALRLGGQFIKLGMCLSTVFGLSEVAEEPFRVVTKVAGDTAYGPNFDILSLLMACHTSDDALLGLDAKQIASRSGYMKEDQVKSKLEDMRHLKLVNRVKSANTHGVRGRHSHLWQVTPGTQKLWDSFIGV